MLGAVEYRTELVAHAVLHDHVAGNLRCALNIVGRAAGNIVKDDLFSYTAAEQLADFLFHSLAVNGIFVLRRGIESISECASGGDNGDLAHRVERGQNVRDNRMTRLVIRRFFLLLRLDAVVFLRHTHDNLRGRFLDIGISDKRLALARGEQRRLVQEVGEIGTGETDGSLRYTLKVNISLKGLVARMNLKDFHASAQIGIVYGDLTVKASGTKERRVKNIGAVCRRHDDDSLVCAEAVHFHKELVERLLALVVTSAETSAAVTSYRVNLIDEYD